MVESLDSMVDSLAAWHVRTMTWGTLADDELGGSGSTSAAAPSSERMDQGDDAMSLLTDGCGLGGVAALACAWSLCATLAANVSFWTLCHNGGVAGLDGGGLGIVRAIGRYGRS